MNPKTQHTPTPWKVDDTYYADVIVIKHGNIPVCEIPKTMDELSTIGSLAQDDANAAFIVRAVNAHAELLENLINIRKCFAARAMRTGCNSAEEMILRQVDATIAKAEGK